jgi:outer membrane protein insertion porin family
MVEYDVETNLKSFLKEHGFLQSEVEWRLVPLEGRDVALHVQIKEGPQYRLADLTVKGITAFSTEDISSQFDLRVGDVLNLVEVKNALQKIMAMYADQGFFECSYLPDMDLDPVKRTAAMSITFEEGTRYRVGYVGFVGCDDQAQEDRLRAQVDIHPGEIYSPTKQKSLLALLKRFAVIESTVENVDEKRGLVGIVFWLQKPQ